jgi:hypothetical protein
MSAAKATVFHSSYRRKSGGKPRAKVRVEREAKLEI